MSKIICDICGSTYQDTAECCPICGCTPDAASELLADEGLMEESYEETAKAGVFAAKKRKEIFDFDEANAEPEDDDEDDDSFDDEEEEEEEAPRHNTFVVILLTLLIVILLLAAGFVFVRYFLPNMGGDDVPETTAPVVQDTADAIQTEAEIPCLSLALTSGTAQLTKEGQYFMLHVVAMPEDTTDVIQYASADESIATVSEDGKITAISEGNTVVYITCGTIQLTCPVEVHYEEETLPPTEETVPETEGEEIGDEDQTAAEETTEATEATEAGGKNVTLKLKQFDITLGVYLKFTLVLDCDLDPSEVEWSSEHPHIVSVDENGVVTALKSGVTDIIVKYYGQEVRCKVRVP